MQHHLAFKALPGSYRDILEKFAPNHSSVSNKNLRTEASFIFKKREALNASPATSLQASSKSLYFRSSLSDRKGPQGDQMIPDLRLN